MIVGQHGRSRHGGGRGYPDVVRGQRRPGLAQRGDDLDEDLSHVPVDREFMDHGVRRMCCIHKMIQRL